MPRQVRPTRKEKELQPLRNDLLTRVIEAKKLLPKSGISPFFIQLNKEYNTVKGKSLLNNVLQLRTADENTTIKLEALAKLMHTKVIDAETIN